MERFRKTDEELRRKLGEKEDETGQLMYVNMANERKIADLSTKVGDVSLFIFFYLFLFLFGYVFPGL
jgi:molybdopterin converting factor small subunit